MALSEADRNRWVRVLSYFILLCKKSKGVLPETDKIMRNYFQLADTSNDKRLNENEVSAFLNSINVKLKKDELKKLINDSDLNQDGNLDEYEFELLLKQVYLRREILSLFKQYVFYSQIFQFKLLGNSLFNFVLSEYSTTEINH
jgi:hypothetical protein